MAHLKKTLCFRCYANNLYSKYYHDASCNQWLVDQEDIVEDQIKKYQADIDNGASDASTLRDYQIRLKKAKTALEKIEALKTLCDR